MRRQLALGSCVVCASPDRLLLLVLLLAGALGPEGVGSQDGASDQPHSRQKRLLWVTNDGRLALPPGTALTITPTLSLPFVRYPPDGFLSNLSISLPFTILFDKLGLTDNENPYGVLPPILARSASRSAGEMVADYIGQLLSHRRRAREAPVERGEQENSVPHRAPTVGANLHGGERAVLYTVVEDLLDNFGMDGKACLLRAICEVHSKPQPIHSLGVLGEILHLFLSASKSPYAALLSEYVEAERTGRGGEGEGHGECWPYYRDCPRSIFRPRNLYTREAPASPEHAVPVAM